MKSIVYKPVTTFDRPVIALGGKIISDYLFPNKEELTKGASIFYGTCGVLLIIAGFINTFLLKVLFKK